MTIAALTQVIRAADKEKPTAEAKAELDKILRESPGVWRAAGDVMEHAARSLIADAGGGSYALRRSLSAGWEQMQHDMARPADGELERLLIQQVALSWLKLAYTEYQHTHCLTRGDTTIKAGDFWERRLSAAQRRHLRAVETLARVRRLQLPAVQVNIAEQKVNQVNTGGCLDRER